MKSSISIFSCLVLLTGWAVAQTPKKAPISKYTTLWTNSPFTSKPPEPVAGPQDNIFDDYALAGVSPISGGYRVTLINKKTPDERITVDTDNPKSQYKVVSVSRKPGDPLGTTVTLTKGDSKGTVSYDDKLLTLVAAPAQAAPPPQAAQVPGQPQVPPGQQPPQRQPRPRVVPPPPAQPGQPAPQVQQAQPGQPQIQQGQPAQQGNQRSQRPERRRN